MYITTSKAQLIFFSLIEVTEGLWVQRKNCNFVGCYLYHTETFMESHQLLHFLFTRLNKLQHCFKILSAANYCRVHSHSSALGLNMLRPLMLRCPFWIKKLIPRWKCLYSVALVHSLGVVGTGGTGVEGGVCALLFSPLYSPSSSFFFSHPPLTLFIKLFVRSCNKRSTTWP